MAVPLDLRIGDRLRLRRAASLREPGLGVVRLGADIGLVCAGCGHRILMDRLTVERRFTGYLARGPEPGCMSMELPPDLSGQDLSGAGSVFRNRSFVALWTAQVLSQLASNMVLAGLMATVVGSDRLEHGERGPDPDLPLPRGRLQRPGRRDRGARRRAPDHARCQRAACPGNHRLHLRRHQHRPDLRHQPVRGDRDRLLRPGRADLHSPDREARQPDGGQLHLRADHQRHLRDRLRLPGAAAADRHERTRSRLRRGGDHVRARSAGHRPDSGASRRSRAGPASTRGGP